MVSNFEIEPPQKHQAGLEAVELLDRAGFVLQDFDITAIGDDPYFELSVSLAVGEHERPLEALEG